MSQLNIMEDDDDEAKIRDIFASRSEHSNGFQPSNRDSLRQLRRKFWKWISLLIFVAFTGWVLAIVTFAVYRLKDFDRQQGIDHISRAIHESPSHVSSLKIAKPLLEDVANEGKAESNNDDDDDFDKFVDNPESLSSNDTHPVHIQWIDTPEGYDGTYIRRGSKQENAFIYTGNLALYPLINSTVLVKERIIEFSGRNFTVNFVKASPDLKKVLLGVDLIDQWRYSFKGIYWILDVTTQQIEPIDADNPLEHAQSVEFSPNSKYLVFVRNNNVFLKKINDKNVIPITKDGNSNIVNGIPDWVYEEDILYSRMGHWWSGSGDFLAFMHTDDTLVNTYPLEYFLGSSAKAEGNTTNVPETEPKVLPIKYSLPGGKIPLVKLFITDVYNKTIFTIPLDNVTFSGESYIYGVFWMGEKLLIHVTDRETNVLRVLLFDPANKGISTLREVDYKAMDGCWAEISRKVLYIPADERFNRTEDGYVDISVNDGFRHLAYFTPLTSNTPRFLTSGPWEVYPETYTADLNNNMIIFGAGKEGPTQRHYYGVSLNGGEIIPITDTRLKGFFTLDISKGGSYGVLTYEGDREMWKNVVKLPFRDKSNETVILAEESASEKMKRKEQLTQRPEYIYDSVLINGNMLEYLERRPKNFDSKKKYPILFMVYQGPESQTIQRGKDLGWDDYLVNKLDIISVTIEGRGTGMRGREFRCIVRGNLGYYEAQDQIAAGKVWAAKSYVDDTRMAIWGWSYGGYTSLKVLEADEGKTFQYALAVAPLTQPMDYDSAFMERYMFLPDHNGQGYFNASVNNVKSIGKAKRFMVIHGSADDNVHVTNVYNLVDKLVNEKVTNFDLMVFPDSNHQISFRNHFPGVIRLIRNWFQRMLLGGER